MSSSLLKPTRAASATIGATKGYDEGFAAMRLIIASYFDMMIDNDLQDEIAGENKKTIWLILFITFITKPKH